MHHDISVVDEIRSVVVGTCILDNPHSLGYPNMPLEHPTYLGISHVIWDIHKLSHVIWGYPRNIPACPRVDPQSVPGGHPHPGFTSGIMGY